MEQKNINKRHIRNDIILIVTVVFISVIGFLYLFMFRPQGDIVKVTVDGEIYGIYSLREDLTEDIKTGKDNSQLNRLIIRGGKAYIETATCPDGICADHRPIFRNGESIVCLPNRVVVTVTTENTDNAPDVTA